jgi:hypothetical protein
MNEENINVLAEEIAVALVENRYIKSEAKDAVKSLIAIKLDRELILPLKRFDFSIKKNL